MKNRKLIIIGLVILFVGCALTNENKILKKESVIVAGNIENIDSKIVSLAFQDIVRTTANYTQIIDTLDGYFKFIFDIYHEQDIRFEYNNYYLTLYVQPSDSIFLSIDNQDNTNHGYKIIFNGKNSRINQEIQDFKAFKKVTSFSPECEGKSVKQYHKELSNQIDKELNALDRFIKKFNPSEKFIQWAKNDIIYTNSNYLLDYKAYLFYNGLPRNDSIFETDLFPLENINSLKSSMFGLHLWHYTTDRYIQNNPKVMTLINEDNYFDAYRNCIENILKNEKGGLLRDIMIYKLMESLLEESIDDFEKYIKTHNHSIGNQLLISELESRLQKTKHSSNFDLAFINNNSKVEYDLPDLFDILIEESQGKTLYLDFWAVWCGPCRTEMPKLMELHERVIEKNIDIISICCNTELETWATYIKDNNIPGKHYHLSKEQTEILKSKFKFQGYPTYMIMKNGIIFNANADRPSSGEKIFNELIKINAL